MTGSIGRPRFVTLEETFAWHEIAIAQHGGSLGLRDRGLLESALAQPRQQFGGEYAHEYPFGMAATYAYYIAKNHPFVDGNKRIALVCCGSFLRMNGWDLVSVGVAAADALLDLVESKRDRESFAQWLHENTRPRPSMELRDFVAAVEPARLTQALSELLPNEQESMPIEFAHLLEEASRAVPAISRFAAQQNEAWRSGDSGQGERVTTLLAGLLALYRLAEEMGYEW